MTHVILKSMKPLALSAMAVSITLLAGCAAVQTGIEHRNLDVNSKMESSIFLDPVSPSQKTIYVSVKNTSSEQDIGLMPLLKSALIARGWKISTDFVKANDRLQINVLQAGKVKNKQDMYASLSNGFGGGLVGGLAGAAIDGGTGAIVGGVAGAAAGWVAGMFVKDVTYSMLTDIQVSQKAANGKVVENNTQSHISQGLSTQIHQSYHSSGHYMTYRTRILSYADKVNLNFKEAKPVLAKQMAHEIANIF